MKAADNRIKERKSKTRMSFTSTLMRHSCVCPHRHDRLPQLRVFTDHRRVHVLAEDGPVVIDISQIDVDGGHVAQRWRTAVCSLDGDVVFMSGLVVQRLDHKDVA